MYNILVLLDELVHHSEYEYESEYAGIDGLSCRQFLPTDSIRLPMNIIIGTWNIIHSGPPLF